MDLKGDGGGHGSSILGRPSAARRFREQMERISGLEREVHNSLLRVENDLLVAGIGDELVWSELRAALTALEGRGCISRAHESASSDDYLARQGLRGLTAILAGRIAANYGRPGPLADRDSR